MYKKFFILFIGLSILLTACGAKAVSQTREEMLPGVGGGAPVYDDGSLPTQAPLLYAETDKDFGNANASSPAAQDRLVIMNADISVVVPDPDVKVQDISQLASELGGFVVSMNMYKVIAQNGESVPEGYISIRVPAEKLDQALADIKADAVEVRNENHSGQDVTSAYVDLKSQLKNLEMAEADLQAIMDEAKDNPNSNTTSKTQDVLSVYNQIISVRGQIESIKGQMQYYEQSSAFSLINCNLIAEETIQPIEIGGWKPEGVARDAIQSLIRFWQGFVDFLITFFLLILPVLVTVFGPIALVVWGIIALVRRRKRRKLQADKQ